MGEDTANPFPIRIRFEIVIELRGAGLGLGFWKVEFFLEHLLELILWIITLESLILEPFSQYPFESFFVIEFVEQQCSVLETEKEGKEEVEIEQKEWGSVLETEKEGKGVESRAG